MPRQMGQVCVLGAPPNTVLHPQKILLRVSIWACTSRPITTSQSEAPMSGHLRRAAMPLGGGLVGGGGAEDRALVERLAQELQADGQPPSGEAAGHAHAGQAGEVAR